MKIGIADYGLGNLLSIQSAFEKIGVSTVLTSKFSILKNVDGVVLPGVGAFSEAMESIKKNKLDLTLHKLVLDQKKPLLGICLGMQILAEYGHENYKCLGLGLIPGEVIKMPFKMNRKVPHVGWSDVKIFQSGKALFQRSQRNDSYYFDHSYIFKTNKINQAATVSCDNEIVAAVSHKNIFGVQFHPEKSQISGLRILKSFCMHCDNQ